MDYVDVRGPWPVYVRGMLAVTLEGHKRNISLDDARIAAELIWVRMIQ